VVKANAARRHERNDEMIQNAMTELYFQVLLPISLLLGFVIGVLILIGKAAAKNDAIREAGKVAGKKVAKAMVSRAMDKFTKF
jgi:hypothetical protein